MAWALGSRSPAPGVSVSSSESRSRLCVQQQEVSPNPGLWKSPSERAAWCCTVAFSSKVTVYSSPTNIIHCLYRLLGLPLFWVGGGLREGGGGRLSFQEEDCFSLSWFIYPSVNPFKPFLNPTKHSARSLAHLSCLLVPEFTLSIICSLKQCVPLKNRGNYSPFEWGRTVCVFQGESRQAFSPPAFAGWTCLAITLAYFLLHICELPGGPLLSLQYWLLSFLIKEEDVASWP